VTWGFRVRADDGTRTRVFSLGTRAERLESGSDLEKWELAVYRFWPLLTGACCWHVAGGRTLRASVLTRWLAVVALLAGSRGIFTCVDRLVDLDAAVVEIERRRERWTALGFLVGPVTWRDEADSWPLTLWTDRALVVDPDSIGVGLERGDLTAANVTLFRVAGLTSSFRLPWTAWSLRIPVCPM
jgi:hypothetical protein